MRCEEERISSSSRTNPDHAPASLVHDARRRSTTGVAPVRFARREARVEWGNEGRVGSEAKEVDMEAGQRGLRSRALDFCLAAEAWKLERMDGAFAEGWWYTFPAKVTTTQVFGPQLPCSARSPQAGHTWMDFVPTPERGPGRPWNGFAYGESMRLHPSNPNVLHFPFATSAGSIW
jgi:hypothetical protein